MAFRFTFTVLGERQIDRTLARFADNIGDARAVWEVLAAKFQRAEARQFATEGAYASGGWPALSPRYAAWKHRHYPGTKILEREGDLKASLTQRPFGVEQIEPGFMVLGTDVDYAIYHQRGSDRLPQRRPVELTEAQRRDWTRTIQRFIVTGQA